MKRLRESGSDQMEGRASSFVQSLQARQDCEDWDRSWVALALVLEEKAEDLPKSTMAPAWLKIVEAYCQLSVLDFDLRVSYFQAIHS